MQHGRRPSSSREFTSIDEIGRTSGTVFGSDPAGDRMRLLRLETAWGRAVGAHLSSISRPFSFSSGRLAVEVASPTWKKELDHLTPSILARLAQVIPAEPVSGISFRVRRGGGPFGITPVGMTGRSQAGAVELAVRLELPHDGDLQNRLSGVRGRYLAMAGRATASR